MTRRRLLDLFCGAGGAAMGYHRAGFDVTGVDINPQPHYPFEFHQADAMSFPLDGYDAVHASPPCQDHSTLGKWQSIPPHGTGWMLAATIDRFRSSGLPFVIENVMGARRDMPGAVRLCGRGFGIARLRRHRLFLVNFAVLVPPCACDGSVPLGIYGDLAKNDRRAGHRGEHVRMRAGVQSARDLLGIDWMDARELTQAIPPAYTEHIGQQLVAHLEAVA